MKITAIKQQVKRPERYSIYIDGTYSFSLSQIQLADSGLHVDQELSTEELKSYKGESELGKLYDRTLRWLAIRPRSEWEIDTYLDRVLYKKSQPDLKPEIIRKLRNISMIDDLAFARSWVESRRLLKPVSRKKLWVELKAKRVSTDVIDQVLDEDETDEQAILRDLIIRKRRQTRLSGRQGQYTDRQKLLAYLARQGFNYDDIKQVLAELD